MRFGWKRLRDLTFWKNMSQVPPAIGNQNIYPARNVSVAEIIEQEKFGGTEDPSTRSLTILHWPHL